MLFSILPPWHLVRALTRSQYILTTPCFKTGAIHYRSSIQRSGAFHVSVLVFFSPLLHITGNQSVSSRYFATDGTYNLIIQKPRSRFPTLFRQPRPCYDWLRVFYSVFHEYTMNKTWVFINMLPKQAGDLVYISVFWRMTCFLSKIASRLEQNIKRYRISHDFKIYFRNIRTWNTIICAHVLNVTQSISEHIGVIISESGERNEKWGGRRIFLQ